MKEKVRLLLFDTDGRLAMMRIPEDRPGHDPIWVTLGGSREAGESVMQTAQREAFEETGVEGVTFGPVVFTGEITLDIKGVPTLVHEDFVVARLPEGARLSRAGWTEEEASVIQDVKFFTPHELRELGPAVRPLSLANVIEPIAQGNYPDAPQWIDLAAVPTTGQAVTGPATKTASGVAREVQAAPTGLPSDAGLHTGAHDSSPQPQGPSHIQPYSGPSSKPSDGLSFGL